MGIELTSNSPEKSAFPDPGGAESGAVLTQPPILAPELAALIDAWPRLPEPIKAGIMAMVRAAK
jgi:hypothetical protein